MAAKKKPKKTDPMLGALAASFGTLKAAPLENEPAPTEEGREEEQPIPLAEPVPEPPVPVAKVPVPIAPPETTGAGVKKTTVSLHPAEQDKIDLILDALLRGRRHRGGFSDAIKIALRLCPIDDESIAQAWDQARAQDLRIARHRRDS
ncbi:MAG: hypothetical protein V4584_00390 [Verrucomicrobiota bacterium]